MHKLRQIDRENWPSLIITISEAVGDEAAMTLFIRFSGRHLLIPKQPNPDHLIDRTIGTEKAALLRKRFAGEVITFPTGVNAMREIRDEKIIKDRRGGMFQADLATKYQLSERQINTIINRQKAKYPNEL